MFLTFHKHSLQKMEIQQITKIKKENGQITKLYNESEEYKHIQQIFKIIYVVITFQHMFMFLLRCFVVVLCVFHRCL